MVIRQRLDSRANRGGIQGKRLGLGTGRLTEVSTMMIHVTHGRVEAMKSLARSDGCG
jgi:hypothetical protein